MVVSAHAQDKKLKSKITTVKVFTQSAQVFRETTSSIPAGKQRIILSELPLGIDKNSIQVNIENATILSVKLSTNYKDELEKNAQLAEIDKQIAALRIKIQDEQAVLSVLSSEERMLLSNRNLAGKVEEVNTEELSKSTLFFNTRMRELKKEQLKINRYMQGLNDEINKLGLERNQIAKLERKASNEIEVLVYLERAANCKINFNYMSANAGWYPYYDLRAESVSEPINFEMKGQVYQSTGEEWTGVDLLLATGNPTQEFEAPDVYPWLISLNNYSNYYKNSQANTAQAANQITTIKGKVYDAQTREVLIGASITFPGSTIGTLSDIDGMFEVQVPSGATTLMVNYIGYQNQTIAIRAGFMNIPMNANNAQMEEVQIVNYRNRVANSEIRNMPATAKQDKISGMTSNYIGRAKNKSLEKNEDDVEMEYKGSYSTSDVKIAEQEISLQTSFEFVILGKHTILGDGKPNQVNVKNIELPAQFSYFVAPKYNNNAFLIANVSGWESFELLDGEMNIFLEGTYLGKSLLDTRTVEDTLMVSFGPDAKIAVERKRVNEFSKKQFLGSNKIISHAYELSIKNNKKVAVDIMVVDQIPVSIQKEIEVSNEIANDGKLDTRTGIIEWKFNLPSATNKKLNFSYKVKAPKKSYLRL